MSSKRRLLTALAFCILIVVGAFFLLTPAAGGGALGGAGVVLLFFPLWLMWRIGTSDEVAWIADGTSVGRTITAAIPSVFDN